MSGFQTQTIINGCATVIHGAALLLLVHVSLCISSHCSSMKNKPNFLPLERGSLAAMNTKDDLLSKMAFLISQGSVASGHTVMSAADTRQISSEFLNTKNR